MTERFEPLIVADDGTLWLYTPALDQWGGWVMGVAGEAGLLTYGPDEMAQRYHEVVARRSSAGS